MLDRGKEVELMLVPLLVNGLQGLGIMIGDYGGQTDWGS
jgi:hypothetical protein